MSAFVQAYMAKSNLSSMYDPNDPLTPIYANLVATYTNKAQFEGTARGNDVLIEACLRAKQIIYYKNTPGDCGKTTQVSAGSLQTGAKAGLLAAGTLTSLASAGIFGGPAGATGIAAEVSSVAVSGAFAAATAGVGLALVPVMMIIQHHQQAVAKEQADLCEVSGFVNSGFAAVRDANVDWATKKNYFNQITSQAMGGLAAVTQKSTGTCNAGCMIGNAIVALRDLYIMLYAQPPSSNILPGVSTPASAQQSGPTATNSQGWAFAISGEQIAAVGGAATIAHYMGAF